MINKFFELIYSKIFVNIVHSHAKTNVYIEVCSKDNNIVNSDEQLFDTRHMTEEIYQFIKSYTDDSPYFYVSVLDNSINQGAIPSCSKDKMNEFHDLQGCEYKCVDSDWAFYSSKYDLNVLENHYEDVGIDYIFSPFSVVSQFFKDKIQNTLSIYVLIEDNALTLSIYDHSKLLFAKYLDMEHEDEELSLEDGLHDDHDHDEEDFDIGDAVNIDDIDIDDDMDSLDDLGDIEDLSDMEDMEDFSEAQDIEEIKVHNAEDDHALIDSDSDGFNEDYQRFSLIQSAINAFYKEPKYESDFVESIYIADNISVSPDLKKYLEEEMFLSVFVRRIDLSTQICEMAKEELS